MNTVFPQLRIEHLENGLIRLEDDSSLETCVLVVHPLQVRHMATALGLVREMSASDADTLAAVRRQHADAARAVLALKRRMLVLKGRIDHLGKSLVTVADHADIDYELTHLTATAEICEAFCADLDDFVSMNVDALGAAPVTLAALPAAELPSVTPAGQASDCSATAGPANPKETQRVTRKASATAAPVGGQQKDLLA